MDSLQCPFIFWNYPINCKQTGRGQKGPSPFLYWFQDVFRDREEAQARRGKDTDSHPRFEAQHWKESLKFG